jgi:hypothetical protein
VATPTPAPKTIVPAGSLQVRFGTVDEDPLPARILRKSAPLPSADEPAFVYDGLDSNHNAVFMITGEVTAEGDGKCLPTPENCERVEMKAGDTEFFDVAQGNAGVIQYELDLLKVFHDKVKGKAAAARAARRVSKGGKDVVHELKAEGDQSMGRYIYSYRRGVLVRRHASRATATASSASTGLDASAHTSSLAGTTWGPAPGA